MTSRFIGPVLCFALANMTILHTAAAQTVPATNAASSAAADAKLWAQWDRKVSADKVAQAADDVKWAQQLAHLIHDGSRGCALAFSQWVGGVIFGGVCCAAGCGCLMPLLEVVGIGSRGATAP